MNAWLTAVILSAALHQSVLLPSESKNGVDIAVEQCKSLNDLFTKHEDKYVKNGNRRQTPNDKLNGIGAPPDITVVHDIYDIGVKQRVFECISRKLNTTSLLLLKESQEYRKLVLSCKSEATVPKCESDSVMNYRTFDGTCNNLFRPKWGSILTCLKRLTRAFYEGVSGFRNSVLGGPLPEPRILALKLDSHKNRPNNKFSNLLPFFGQMVSHDFTNVPESQIDGKEIDCCANVKKENLHPQCAPIHIPKNDPFYSIYNVTCIDFRRAAPCGSCSVGKRNQMNTVTSFIDLSTIYGSHQETADKLRAKDGTGMLIFQLTKAGMLLPPDHSRNALPGSKADHYQFLSGDTRIVQHSPLMCQHTLFFRNHNRIAKKLKILNPFWSEEKLFEEARKINIAMAQVIIYKEFLPCVVGSNLMTKYDLWVRKGKRTEYVPTVDPAIRVEFNTAAYRLHTAINGNVIGCPAEDNKSFLKDLFLNPSPIYNNEASLIFKGMCQVPAQKYDRYVVTDLTKYLFRKPGVPYGLDMTSINIQRGRDNGLPPYVDMRKFLSKYEPEIHSFEQLKELMPEKNVAILRELYRNVRDIDSYVGMISENVPDGMFLGQTARIIIAKQFSYLLHGDRFFYSHGHHFTDKQLQSLQDVTYARLLCDNMDTIETQLHTFLLPDSERNPIIPCSEIPDVDLNLWRKMED